MFNYDPVNNRAVNGTTQLPLGTTLTINATDEGLNILSWDIDILANFYNLYWSTEPFTSIDDPGVLVIYNVSSSYTHTVPQGFLFNVLYYRVASVNQNGSVLSNQVDSYSYKIAIYNDTFNSVLNSILDNFTPEIRRQYRESIIWKSFVESIAQELAAAKIAIKDSVQQLNIQKAADVFLQLWSDLTSIRKQNVVDSISGVVRQETDSEFKNRILDNVFWDKISNATIKKSLLLKLGFDSQVIDQGPADFYAYAAGKTSINSKLLSNIYYVSIAGASLTEADRENIWSQASALSALGNVLMSVLEDLSLSFLDVDATFGTIAYGPIFMGWATQNNRTDKATDL